jgi:putative ABC transport system permease protein
MSAFALSGEIRRKGMLKNYFNIALRNLLRHRAFSFINICGLAVGIACAILILLWVQYEFSYDTFHEHKGEIYRITTSTETGSGKVISPTCPRPLGRALVENLPGVVCSSTFQLLPKIIVRKGEIRFYETQAAGADSSFFEIFSFKFVHGSPGQALRDPFSVVLTQNAASKYFGTTNPIDQSLEIDGVTHKVTGVIENVPSQSHIRFDFLASNQILDKYNGSHNWESINWSCYVLLRNNTNSKDIVAGMNRMINAHVPNYVAEYKMHGELQPLSEIHLGPHYDYEYAEVTDIKTIVIFASIACMILLIACFNFMNLSTAMASHRMKEIGLRKVAGSQRTQLVFQFIGECIFFTAVATVIAVCLVELALPAFTHFYHKALQIDFLSSRTVAGILGLIIFVGGIAGVYPAFYLSSLNPAQIFKGNVKKGRNAVFRKALLTVQFSISVGLIICATILSQQIHFLLNKDLGFDKDNILYVPLNGKAAENYQAIKNELLEQRYIGTVSAKDYLPTATWNNTIDVDWEGNSHKGTVKIQEHECDYEYFQTLNIPFIQGRNFSKEYTTDAQRAFILNEEAVRQMGLEAPVGKSFSLHGRAGKVIGVVKNAYFQSLQNKVVPKVYSVLTDFRKHTDNIMLVKYKVNEFQKLQDIIKSTGNIVSKYNPDYPFEFNFLDETIGRNYVQVERFNTIIGYLTLLAGVTAFLGLFGLTLFTMKKRTKEIGIRKALGASVASIIALFFKDFLYLIILANLIAWPIAYYFMNGWLQDYAYRIDIQWWVFVLSAATVLLAALITVSCQAIRAATANPTSSLRYE